MEIDWAVAVNSRARRTARQSNPPPQRTRRRRRKEFLILTSFPPLLRGGESQLRKRDRADAHRPDGWSESAAARGGQGHGISALERRQVTDVRERRDLVVRRAGDVDHGRRADRLVLPQGVGGELPDAARRDGGQGA